MRTRSVLVVTICVVILISSFDCKKPTKEVKNKKTKEVKQQKNKIDKTEKVEAEPVKAGKVKVNKQKSDKVKIVEVEEVQKPADEEVTENDTNFLEQSLETGVHHSDTTKPKSLKALTAYDQCKIECRKQRDHIEAQEYVEQLRQELAAAEAILAEQATATSLENASADKSESSLNHQL